MQQNSGWGLFTRNCSQPVCQHHKHNCGTGEAAIYPGEVDVPCGISLDNVMVQCFLNTVENIKLTGEEADGEVLGWR